MSNRRLIDEIINSGNDRSAIREKDAIIKNRAENIIASATTLMDDIESQYGSEISSLLEKRLLSAIKTRNPDKFRFKKR